MAAPRVGFINRVAGNRVMTVSANVTQGVQTAKVQEEIAKELATADLGTGVTWRLKGEDEERAKAGVFLMKAFGTAIFMIFAILLAQFNRLTSVGLVCPRRSVNHRRPPGTYVDGSAVRCGDDRDRRDRQRGRDRQQQHCSDRYLRPLAERRWEAYDAIVETCRERARPVVLTAVTAVLGVLRLPLASTSSFSPARYRLEHRRRSGGSVFRTAIVFGLAFATVLTLVVTPAALMAIEQGRQRREVWGTALRARFARQAQ